MKQAEVDVERKVNIDEEKIMCLRDSYPCETPANDVCRSPVPVFHCKEGTLVNKVYCVPVPAFHRKEETLANDKQRPPVPVFHFKEGMLVNDVCWLMHFTLQTKHR